MPEQPPTCSETGSTNSGLLDVAREAAAVAASIIRDAAPRSRAIAWREKGATDFVSEVNVACGRFEGFWKPRLSPWNVAAGMLQIREAGGVVTTLDGTPCPVPRTSVVAGSAVMHPWLLSVLNEE